jgi:hypothetical protein
VKKVLERRRMRATVRTNGVATRLWRRRGGEEEKEEEEGEEDLCAPVVTLAVRRFKGSCDEGCGGQEEEEWDLWSLGSPPPPPTLDDDNDGGDAKPPHHRSKGAEGGGA